LEAALELVAVVLWPFLDLVLEFDFGAMIYLEREF